jgi:hypothetical protein
MDSLQAWRALTGTGKFGPTTGRRACREYSSYSLAAASSVTQNCHAATQFRDYTKAGPTRLRRGPGIVQMPPAAPSTTGAKRLIVLGCSAVKRKSECLLPAVSLYDGPTFRVLRSFLREFRWPSTLSIAVLSAKYGMIGGVSPISTYDQRMTPERAAELGGSVTSTLRGWAGSHARIDLLLGQDYLLGISPDLLRAPRPTVQVVDGPIGMKLSRLRSMLREIVPTKPRRVADLPRLGRPLYFLPDWDDFLDLDYDFENDRFSHSQRASRRQQHSIGLMRPKRLCDGVLVSLAQNLGTKGLLKRVGKDSEDSLAPRSVRDFYNLHDDQWAFGDCGAFSYANEEAPTISVEQAVTLYDLYDFDLGASVDHIPIPEIVTPNGKRSLSEAERTARVRLTQDNAERFIQTHRERAASFTPVGVIQGLDAESYANQVGLYSEMGYRHIALGGLVPRSDAEVLEIVKAVHGKLSKTRIRPWIHLLGVFRPSLQGHFRECEVGSFDSATYFRKAWLRSDQNYLGVDGRWYAAIRVPPLSDPRTLKRLQSSGVPEAKLRGLEKSALRQLRAYDRGETSIDSALSAVLAYDRLLSRAELLGDSLIDAYRKTLEERPWKACRCKVCKDLGIEVLIFRGINRNKRRGAHNTLRLFERVTSRNP